MFPRRMSLLEIRVVDLSLRAGSTITLEDDVAVDGECFPSGRDSCLCLWCCTAAPGRRRFLFSIRVVLASIGVSFP